MLIPHWPIYTGPNKDFINATIRVKYILSQLGNPHLKMKNIIHITGTKGKGSTALYISNILKASSYKVNTYISPHIYECNERILLNGQKITDDEIYNNIETIRIICEKQNIEPALFEAMTCCAFMSMSKNNADFNVVEVGCGGLYDATNIFDNNHPICCIFTPIHLDHTKILGSNIENITLNKSFIIKPNTKNVILSSQSKEAKYLLQKVSTELNVKNFYSYQNDYEVFKDEDNGQPIYESKTFNTCFKFQTPNMIGDYQLINCGCAITTCLSLQNENILNNLSIQNINIGISNTINIVRMEKITNGTLFNLLPKGSIFYVDGAHNQLAAYALSRFIQNFKNNNKTKNYKIIVAIARTKGANNESFLKELLDKKLKPIIDLLICTRANLESIPEPPEEIVKTAKKLGFNYEISYSIQETFEKITSYIKNQKTLFIATGSLYIARDIHF